MVNVLVEGHLKIIRILHRAISSKGLLNQRCSYSAAIRIGWETEAEMNCDETMRVGAFVTVQLDKPV